MRATVLIDNIADKELTGEWGLSVYIEYNGHSLLLDCGTTDGFTVNAERLNVDLSQVEYGILSHGHYDHSDGMEAFFKINSKAHFFLREGAGDLYYSGTHGPRKKYIGIKKTILNDYSDRLVFVKGDYEIIPGVWLIPHKTGGLEAIGEKALLYVRRGRKYIPDSFSHEQSLVLDTKKGLVVFNSCSHGGADNIIREISSTFPNKHIHALVGGFHLYRTSDEEVRQFARRVKATGIESIITGHCTGEHAYDILFEELGTSLQQMKSGMIIDI